ncbi:proline dehydrogenase family protein [Pedobacter alpinus]|uniref:Proline dehydrogenase family protein n=1 Tax=Pedobacter alpinus TaxID=1590643 RepID=A0ABW5TRP7_9SPHI
MQNLVSTSKLSFDNTEIAFKQQSNKELKKSYWLFKMISNNLLVKVGPFFTKAALFFRLPISGLIKKTIFSQFCGGETIDECTITINKLVNGGVGTILDYSVEGEDTEKVFDLTALEIINTIKKAVEMPSAIPFCVFKITGIARFSLIEKINSKQTLSAIETKEWEKAVARVNLICETAAKFKQSIMIDAEESWIQNIIDELAMLNMMEFNKEKAIVFNTYQLYRHDKLASLIADVTIAQTQNFILGAKLVRGAYMEKERKRAIEKGYKSPIQPNKTTTDRDYNAAISFCLDNINDVAIVAGTHNQYSCQVLVEKMEQRQIAFNHPHIYFSQLLGMSDNLSFNLASENFNVAKYVPYGPVKSVLPYLVRRAEENTAVAGQMGRELSLIINELKRRRN